MCTEINYGLKYRFVWIREWCLTNDGSGFLTAKDIDSAAGLRVTAAELKLYIKAILRFAVSSTTFNSETLLYP